MAVHLQNQISLETSFLRQDAGKIVMVNYYYFCFVNAFNFNSACDFKRIQGLKIQMNSIQILVHFDSLNFPNNNFSNFYFHRICRIFIHQFNSWLIKWHPQALRNKASLTVSSQRMMSMLLSNYLKIHSLR